MATWLQQYSELITACFLALFMALGWVMGRISARPIVFREREALPAQTMEGAGQPADGDPINDAVNDYDWPEAVETMRDGK